MTIRVPKEIKPEEYRAPARGLPTRIIRLTGPASSIRGEIYGQAELICKVEVPAAEAFGLPCKPYRPG